MKFYIILWLFDRRLLITDIMKGIMNVTSTTTVYTYDSFRFQAGWWRGASMTLKHNDTDNNIGYMNINKLILMCCIISLGQMGINAIQNDI